MHAVLCTNCVHACLAVFLSVKLSGWKKKSIQQSSVRWRITENKYFYLYGCIRLLDVCNLIYLSLEELHEVSVPRNM